MDNIIEAIYPMLKTYNEQAGTVDIDEYNKDINEAIKEMDNGNYTTHQEAKNALLNDAGK